MFYNFVYYSVLIYESFHWGRKISSERVDLHSSFYGICEDGTVVRRHAWCDKCNGMHFMS